MNQLLEPLFNIGSPLVFPFWILMVFLPHWKWTKRIMQSPWVILGPVFLYLILVFPVIGDFFFAVNPPSLESVNTLLASEVGTVGFWQHLLAFDLFMGRWVYLDSRENNISAWLIVPVLFLVLMLPPLGFLSYFIVRTVWLVVRENNWSGVWVSPV